MHAQCSKPGTVDQMYIKEALSTNPNPPSHLLIIRNIIFPIPWCIHIPDSSGSPLYGPGTFCP
jgi:hypothetical protein